MPHHFSAVMAGLVPAIHVLLLNSKEKTWMPATGAGMTVYRACPTRSSMTFRCAKGAAIDDNAAIAQK